MPDRHHHCTTLPFAAAPVLIALAAGPAHAAHLPWAGTDSGGGRTLSGELAVLTSVGRADALSASSNGLTFRGGLLIAFARATPCRVDLAPGGVLDLFDILQFLDLFSMRDPRADFSSESDGAVVLDVFDVIAFFDAFAEGCG